MQTKGLTQTRSCCEELVSLILARAEGEERTSCFAVSDAHRILRPRLDRHPESEALNLAFVDWEGSVVRAKERAYVGSCAFSSVESLSTCAERTNRQ